MREQINLLVRLQEKDRVLDRFRWQIREGPERLQGVEKELKALEEDVEANNSRIQELKKIQRVLAKRMDTAPHEVLLVLDATTGQNGLSQARLFTEAVGVTGVVLTKLDGTARGGIVVAVCQELAIPVTWVGVGEGLDDLVVFDAEAFAEGMLGS